MRRLPVDRLAPADRLRMTAVLEAGPWVWPAGADEPERRLVAAGRPQVPAVGTTLGVSVAPGDRAATVWLIDARPGQLRDASLDSSAVETWNTAALALPRAIPLVWRSLREIHRVQPRLVWIDTWAPDETHQRPEHIVTGTSFGMAFVLVLASRLVGLPLPGDLLCSVAIDAEGRVAGVGGLATKLRAVAAIAPGVGRVMVAASQESEARRDVEESAPDAARLTVVGVTSVGHALEVAFGVQRLAEALAGAGDDPGTRGELARSFFALALQGRGEFVDWTPLEQASALAATWPTLDASERYMVEFARGVAARHERNQGVLTLPTPEWLAQWPLPVACQVVTHVVQQAADTGSPDAVRARALAESYRPLSLDRAFLPQLKLEGALARLDAVTGHGARALRTQLELATLYLDAFLPGEMSFPLSEAYRLAGVLDDQVAFSHCERLSDRADSAGGLGVEGSPYVRLARARAVALMGLAGACEAARTLRSMAGDTNLPAHVRWSAARWAHRVGADAGMDELAGIRAALEAATAEPDARRAHAARVHLHLLRLDDALAGGDEAAAVAAVAALRALEGGLVGLLEAWAAPRALTAHVARHYPY